MRKTTRQFRHTFAAALRLSAMVASIMPGCAVVATAAPTVLIGPGVNNGDFETIDVVAPTTFISGSIPAWMNWSEVDTADNDTGVYDSPTLGTQTAYLQGGGAIRNMTAHTIAEGDMFEYSFDNALAGRSAARMELVYDDGGVITNIPGTAISGGPVNTVKGGFVVAAGDPWIGKTVGVGLTPVGSWPEVDNVVLTEGPTVPTVTLPVTAQVYESDTLALTATITGVPYPTLQWKTNGVNVAGGTNNPLVYTNMQLSQSGLKWSIEATNAEGAGSATTTVTVVEGTQIMVVDLDDVGVWGAYDLSTGAESTDGLTASASLTGKEWQETPTYWWNSATPLFNTAQTATWAVSGYAPGVVVRVYAHWRDEGIQGNGDTAASYVVNGAPAVVKNQAGNPVADLTLNDGANDHNFELVGYYVADGAGQVQVVLSRGNNWTVADAVALETTLSSPPTVTLPSVVQVFETGTLELGAIVTGAPYPGLQWKTNGVVLAGATNSSLVYTNIQLSQSGVAWSIEATNAFGADDATTTVKVSKGTQIMVVDADNGSWAAYDSSTGAENANGLTGSFTSSGLAWQAASGLAWNGEHGGYANPGEGDTAAWTVAGYAPGSVVRAYVHWHHQHNTTTGMPYTVNGGIPVVKDQENTPPEGDIVLKDPLTVSRPFEVIDFAVADSTGYVQVAIGDPMDGPGDHDFGNVDAVAFETLPSARFKLLEDFESHALSNDIDTAGGWVEFGNELPAGGSVVQDPTNSANRVARLTGDASNDGYVLALGANAIVEGSRGTVFLRYRSTGSISAYLTDADALGPPSWWTEDEAGIYNNFNLGDGSAVRPLWNGGEIGDIELDTWYNVWIVVDHVADTFSLHLSRDLDHAVGDVSSMSVDANESFRSGAATGDLDHFFIVSNNDARGGMIDDIYIAQGVNLALPDELLPPGGTVLIVR